MSPCILQTVFHSSPGYTISLVVCWYLQNTSV